MEGVGPGVGPVGEPGPPTEVQPVLPDQEPPASQRVPGGGEGQEQLRLVSSLQAAHLLHPDRRWVGGQSGPVIPSVAEPASSLQGPQSLPPSLLDLLLLASLHSYVDFNH